jgi:uncharacterized protein involved in outer membrane biogenesis
MPQTVVNALKRILIVVALIIVLPIFGATVYVLLSDASLIKAVLESMATDLAGAQVHFGRLDISLKDARLTAEEVIIFNPAGFKGESAIRLAQASVAIAPSSIAEGPLVIHEIALAGPDVTYEVAADGHSNLEFLGQHALDQINADRRDTPRKIFIDRLDITGGRIAGAAPLPGTLAGGRLNDVHLIGIGDDSNGETMLQVAHTVFAALAGTMGTAAESEKVREGLNGLPGGSR